MYSSSMQHFVDGDVVEKFGSRTTLLMGSENKITNGSTVEVVVDEHMRLTLGKTLDLFAGAKATASLAATVDAFIGFKCALSLAANLTLNTGFGATITGGLFVTKGSVSVDLNPAKIKTHQVSIGSGDVKIENLTLTIHP